MKIAVYSPFYPPFEGGAERVAARVATGLSQHHAVTVFTLRDDPAQPEVEAQGALTVRRFAYRQRRILGFTWVTAPDLLAALQSADYDVLHLHNLIFPNLGVQAARAARRRGKPTLLIPHGLFEAVEGVPGLAGWRKLLYGVVISGLLRLLLGFSSHVGLLSPSDQPIIERFGKRASDVSVLWNGVDTPPSLDSPEVIAQCAAFRERYGLQDAVIALQVGNIKPNKGHHLMLSALHTAGSRLPDNFRYVVVGDTSGMWADYKTEIQAQIARDGLEDRVCLLGRLSDDDLKAAYFAADMVVLPSLAETMPLAALEAMGYGRALISSRVGGVPQVVTSGEEGILFPIGDHQALADALVQVSTDLSLRQQLGQAARERVIGVLSWDKVIMRYEAVSKRLIENENT